MRQFRSLIFLLVSAGAALPLMAQSVRPRLPNAAAAYRPPIQTNAGDVTWNSGTYLYDPAGNITAIGPQRYTYDTNGRLVEAHIAGADGASDQSIAYDVYGNITSMARDGVSTTTSVNASTNRLSFASYDAAGNVTSYQPPGSPVTYQFGYDALNMVQVTKLNGSSSPSTAYVYAPADERIWSYNTATNVSHWKIRGLDNKILRDYTDTGSATIVAKDYFYRDGTMLAAMTPAIGTQSQLLEQFSVDHLGTPRLITDGEGHKIGFHTYYPFGQEWTNATNDVEALKFTGHERDADTVGSGNDVDYMHARYYLPNPGRFLSVDPALDLKRSITHPQAWNRYAYVETNPVNRTDPTGKYLCSGSQVQCKNFEASLSVVRAAAAEATRQHLEGAGKLNAIVAAYGKFGVKTSISVVFGATKNGARMQTTWRNAGAIVTVNPARFSDDVAGRQYVSLATGVAHEGDHSVGMLTNPAMRNTNSRSTLLDSERSAYRAGGYVYQSLGIDDTSRSIWQRNTGFTPLLEHFAQQSVDEECAEGCSP